MLLNPPLSQCYCVIFLSSANVTDILKDQIIKNVCVCSRGSVAVVKSFGEL